ncbi:MAG: SNF2-related protein, partial [Verrucomicrobiales bacterium]
TRVAALTEDDLIDMAGWPVLKRARALLAAGSVLSANHEGNLLKGTVAQGKKEYSCGLLIHSKIDTDNLCTCLESKRDGQICAHTVAVGLALIEGLPKRGREKPKGQPKLPPATRWTIHIPRAFTQLWNKGTLPVRLTPGGDVATTPRLTAFFETVGLARNSDTPSLLRLDLDQAGEFFAAAAGQPEIYLEGSDQAPEPLRFSEIPCRLPLALSYLGDGNISLGLDLGEALLLRSASSIWVFQQAGFSSLLHLPLPGGGAAIAELSDLFESGKLTRPLNWLADALPLLNEAFHLSSPDGLLAKLDLSPPSPQIHLAIEGSLRHLEAELSFHYPEPSEAGSSLDSQLAAIASAQSNPAVERGARDRLAKAGFDQELTLRGEPAILDFFASQLPELEIEWQVSIGERFQHVTRDIQRLRPQLETHGAGEDWFSFSINYNTDQGQTLSAGEIRRLLDSGENCVKSGGGKRIAIDRAALDDLQEVLRDTDPDQSGGDYRVSPAQAEYIRDTLHQPTSDSAPPPAPETAVGAELRPYQKTGVDWLFQRLGGSPGSAGAILADEMGLGKTLQTLTLISALESESPALVVCPTSLIHSWAAEAHRFAPFLKPLVVQGTAAKRKAALADPGGSRLILTSYGSLLRDLEWHKKISYSLVTIDEASYIKNPDTKNAKAARELAARAPARLALTGTPIENSVRDLWSIMEFALPGYLGSGTEFRQRYELPIKSGSTPELVRLRRRLAPFLLRRTKRVVAKDLPEKIEQVIYCELAGAQRDAYETFLKQGREQIQQLLDTQGLSKARMSILTTLLRLRQTCCHLRLIDAESDATSGKLEALRTLVNEALEGGHRVLIFSQFVNMLALIRESLDSDGLRYAYLDGSTPADQRAAQVKAFQAGDDLPIFLISLKAGGYGLTLTAADTVIHFDPWWNPAVENQATDRAHRIGQQNPVTAYKLITTGTIEERILALQKKKQRVIETALEDETPMMSGLTEQDIREILS